MRMVLPEYCNRCALFFWIFPSLAVAGIATDGTVGPASILSGPNYAISASLGKQVGTNLFQSFSTFNLVTGERATFSGPNGISDIIARVTGGASSSIDGQLVSTIPNANLIFINPSGIVFGPNASLNISGSFYASTANYVRLSDDGRFDASNPQNDLLTTAPISAFGFLGPNAAPISVAGSLTVPQGNILALVGGNIDMAGASLLANGGGIAIVAVASQAEITASGLDTSSVKQFGNVSVSGSTLDVSEAANANSGSGAIYIRGGQIVLNSNSFVTSNTASGNGGNIDIQAIGDLKLDSSVIQAQTAGNGNAGLISLAAAGLTLANGAQIDSSTQPGSSGTGGVIQVVASDTISISGQDANNSPSGIFGQVHGTGSGGFIDIKTKNLSLDNNGLISASAFNSGMGGALMIDASGLVSLKSSDTIAASSYGAGDGGYISLKAAELNVDGGLIRSMVNGSGTGGYISIDTGKFSLVNGGQISSSSSAGSLGSLGYLQIQATDSISISGQDVNGNPSGIYGRAHGTGSGGLIDIKAKNLSLDNNGLITASAYSTGTGGAIMIDTSGLLGIKNGGQIAASSYGAGNGGYISLKSPEINLDGGIVTSLVNGSGNGGYISVDAGKLTLINGAQIDSSSSAASAGNLGGILIAASDATSISGQDVNGNPSGLYGRVKGTGDGGVISIKAKTLNLSDSGLITASAYRTGTSGAIVIDTSGLLGIKNGGQIAASSYGAGNGGYILLKSPEIILDGGIVTSLVNGSGNGGYISVDAGKLTLINGAQIDSSSSAASAGDLGGILIAASDATSISGTDAGGNSSGIYGQVLGSGNGGFIDIKTGNLSIGQNGTIDASTSSSGWGGNIGITATTSVSLKSGSRITSQSTGLGLAGNISIDAGYSFTGDNSSVTTGATLADGGNISLIAMNLINMNNSSITSTVGTGVGNGGNIFLDPLFVVMNGSTITANAFGGNGGNINLIATNFLRSANSSITASSKLGVSGTVTMNGQLTDLSGSLADLPIAYLNTAGLLRARCAASMAGAGSSFVLAGRGGMPEEPDMLIPSAMSAESANIQAGQGAVHYASLVIPGFGCTN